MHKLPTSERSFTTKPKTLLTSEKKKDKRDHVIHPTYLKRTFIVPPEESETFHLKGKRTEDVSDDPSLSALPPEAVDIYNDAVNEIVQNRLFKDEQLDELFGRLWQQHGGDDDPYIISAVIARLQSEYHYT